MEPSLIEKCQEVLGYRFSDPDILVKSLTHASSSAPDEPNNERLEFLGDAIVGLVICEHLFQRFPDYAEGHLTRMKSAVVSRSSLGRVARHLGMDAFIIVGPGMAKRKHLPNSLYANVFEAIVAAIHIDGGLDAVTDFILRFLEPEIRAAEGNKRYQNYKSTLQHYAQRENQITPTYKVIREEGPDHLKFFEVIAVIGEKEYATGWGRNKKEAEQRAAEETLKALDVEPED